jgi:histone H3/H4
MEDITKPSITRLARRAGVKSVSDDCFNPLRELISRKLNEFIGTALVINSEHQTKTLMADDIYDACSLLDIQVTQSTDLGKSTCSKN